ncbi:MAG: bifunctional DNA primase/polymerase [Armatimonadetes bacterium]|nr:bifunctional DNA primase/polymerase [Armatimonadota bacterium]
MLMNEHGSRHEHTAQRQDGSGSAPEQADNPARAAAQRYLRRGWLPIPVPFRQKRPVLKGWQALRLAEATLERYFRVSEMNIGVLLGEPSGNLADVDLDCEAARRLAGRFLPPTGAVFGRPGNPSSHRLYRLVRPARTAKFEDTGGAMLVELRFTGAQTVFPPSTHESGEAIRWVRDGDPAECDPDDLMACLARLAAASSLARRWPQGSRQEAVLALTGGLLRAGWEMARLKDFLKAVTWAAGDEESAKRLAAVEDTAARLKGDDRVTGWPRLAALIGEKEVTKLLGWLGVAARERLAPADAPLLDATDATDATFPTPIEAPPPPDRLPLARKLLDLTGAAFLFHTPEGQAFAALPVESRREVWPLRGREFRHWLQRAFYQQEGKPAGAQAFQEALEVLEARARYDGPEEPVSIRVGWREDALYLDLADDSWQAVEVTACGWRVVADPPIRFRRTAAMRPLPAPAPGGSLAELRDMINAPEEDAWRLIAAWLVGALHPTGPYPLLIVQGEQGSAKSTAARLLRQVIDPSGVPLRAAPHEERDLVIGASHCWVLAYDNLSGLAPWLSDALCRLSTGGGFATRELYSDDGEVVFQARRAVLLNGIEDLATRSDLADRALSVVLPPIPDGNRRTGDEVEALFHRAHPRILGALLDAVSAALRNRPRLRPQNLPRMADFALWVMAAEESLPWKPGGFRAVYDRSRRDALTVSLESDPVAVALQRLLATRGSAYEATATDLLNDLAEHASEPQRKARAWPQSPRALTNRLRRLAPLLRSTGLEPIFERKPAGQRVIRFTRSRESCVGSVGCVESAGAALSPATPPDPERQTLEEVLRVFGGEVVEGD